MAEKIPVIYKMGPTENLSNVPIKKGQILVTNDKGKMYIDVADEQRLPVGGTENVVGQKTAEGGEIFNAEYDNTAGGKCFSIKSINKNLIRKNLEALAEQGLTLNADGSFELVFGDYIPIFTLNPGKYYVSTQGDYTTNRGEQWGITYGPSGTVWYQISGIVENGSFFRLDQSGVLEITEKTTLCLTCHQTGPIGPGGRDIETGRLFISITKGQTPPTTLECQEYDYELDSVEGIEVGDIYSLKIGANYDFYGRVTHLDTNNNIVTVSSFTEGTTTDLSDAVMWFPYKPQIGTQVNGGAQHSEGYETTAINWGSHSEGFNTLAEGKYSHTENHSTVAGYASHAEGQNTKALGEWSHAQGMATSALNRYTFSFGNSTVSMENYFNGKVLTTLKNEEIEKAWKNANPKFTCANGYASTAGGNNTLALGSVSTALGKETIAKGNNSLSTGYLTSAEGENSASFGKNTHAIGDNSIAIGDNNTAYGKNSITFGSNNNNITEWEEYETDGTYLYDDSPNNCIDSLQIEGSENIIKKSEPGPLYGETIIKNSHIEGANNQFDVRYYSEMLCSHIEGRNNKIGGTTLNGSHVEGLNNNIEYTLADGGNIEASHIEGYNNKIKTVAIQSHIEGAANTIGSSDYDKDQVCIHVEGYNNKIFNSNYSHTQGTTNTVTNSPSSHVGGWNNKITNGNGAFAHGHCLIVNGVCNTSFGRYNAPVDKTYFSIGNGTDKNRSNAFLVYIDGHAELPSLKNKNGELDSTAIGTSDYAIVTKGYVDSPKEYFLLKDSVTGENYKISIANGKLTMEVAE